MLKDLSADERKAYHREVQRRYRKRVRDSKGDKLFLREDNLKRKLCWYRQKIVEVEEELEQLKEEKNKE